MERIEFDFLFTKLVGSTRCSKFMSEKLNDAKASNTEKSLQDKGWLDQAGSITKAGMEALEPYKVDNAVIMAAGLSSRCLPLSKILPKGLFVVKGEVLIERQIKQLKDAGINQIIVVTGYLAEKFEYLREKYGVTIVKNEEYKTRNNTSSVYAAREHFRNTYVCCADNYFKDNIFSSYVYDSYYTCKHSEKFLDEFCLTKIDENGYIQEIRRGGSGYYTMGAVYFSRSFSKRFLELLEQEYHEESVKGMLIDTFHIIHMADLPSTFSVYADDEIMEFDTLSEFQDFDPKFESFYSRTMEESLFERYNDIDRYAGVPTDWVTGRLHYNENLWGPSPKCMDALYRTRIEDLYLYDSTAEDDLLLALETYTDISRKNLFLHNGSAESIKSLFSVMLNHGDTVLLPTPGWSYYAGIVDYKFCKTVYYNIIEGSQKCRHDVPDLMEKAKQYAPKIIVVTSPAMPTGNAIPGTDLEYIIKNNPGSMILVDEAYYGFCPYDLDVNYIVRTYDNVIFSRTFSKYFGLANLRIGYGICSEKAMHAMWLDLPLHRLPHISKSMAIAALEDTAYYEEVAKETINTREWFWQELGKLENVRPFRSDANFLYIALKGYDVSGIKKNMEDNGYLIRIFESHSEQHLRITIGPKEIMEDCLHKLIAAMEINRITP